MSRDKILAAVRAALPPAQELPDLLDFGVHYDDPISQFITIAEAIAATVKSVPSRSEIAGVVGDFLPEAQSVLSQVPEVATRQFERDVNQAPHAYRDLDLIIVDGVIPVAENAAIWVPDTQYDNHAAMVLTQHQVIVVHASTMVHNMHQAYAQVAAGDVPRFGFFLSGPTKTADIEQSLVIGAQGTRSVLIILVRDESA
ncbi:MAG: L-lactate dehydrogenase complex protein LldG [Kiritimatiellia bacterium]|jgi:L-lactate dehydrogenase complex protein LldG